MSESSSDNPFGDVISCYTIHQAEEDGVLDNVGKMRPEWANGLISHITRNLMSNGYYEENGEVRLVNVVDLLNQSIQIVRRGLKRDPGDTFFSGRIELPSGQSQEVYIQLNELGRLTVMLPEDY